MVKSIEEKTMPIIELFPLNKGAKHPSLTLSQNRILIGRSENCHLVIPLPNISSVHAVIEIKDGEISLYDMNSTNGTFVNGQKVVSAKISIGDNLSFASIGYCLREWRGEEQAGKNEASSKRALPAPIDKKNFESFLKAEIKNSERENVSSSPLPLARFKNSEFSEYIFEEDQIYPIFKYEVQRNAVEVLIIFQDRIQSMDYLPLKRGVYYLSGRSHQEAEIELASLPKEDKIPFIEVEEKGVISLHSLADFEILFLSDSSSDLASSSKKKLKNQEGGPYHLQKDDWVRFHKNNLQIFVRLTDCPPQIRPTPLLRRDQEFRKFLFASSMLYLILVVGLFWVEVKKDPVIDQKKNLDYLSTLLKKREIPDSRKSE